MDATTVIGRLLPLESDLRRAGLSALYLFGSTARGDVPPRDVDLAFDVSETARFSILDQAKIRDRIADTLEENVDLVERLAMHPLIGRNAQADLIRIFG